MKVAFLAGFSYPVEVQCSIRFSRSFDRGRVRWFSGVKAASISELQDAVSRELDLGNRVFFLTTRDFAANLPNSIERWRASRPKDFEVRLLHQDDARKVKRDLAQFLGPAALEPALGSTALAKSLRGSRVACVAERGHAISFRTTLAHAGLLGLGIEFVEVSYSFPQKGSKAIELLQGSAQFSWLLYASSGLGPLQPNVLRAYDGRVAYGPQPIDAVRFFTRVAHAEEEQRELAAAREVQESLIPSTAPVIAGFDVATRWRPARLLAGDCYDFISLPEGVTAFFIADVAGKGHPAAMLASLVLGAIRAYANQRLSPKEMISQVNRDLCERIPEGKLVTAFYGELEPVTRRMVYVNAGHPPPVVVRPDGTTEKLDAGGLVLGAFRNQCYEEGQVVLDGALLMFTDGITEASNGLGEDFGCERLTELLVRATRDGLEESVHAIMDAVEEHCGGEFRDDATIVVIRPIPSEATS